MTTRPRHDCHLTLFHFATRFSSSPPGKWLRPTPLQTRKADQSALQSLENQARLTTTEFQNFAGTRKSHSLLQQDYQAIENVAHDASEPNSVTLKAETARPHVLQGVHL